eukprot:g16146.t1
MVPFAFLFGLWLFSLCASSGLRPVPRQELGELCVLAKRTIVAYIRMAATVIIAVVVRLCRGHSGSPERTDPTDV